MLINVRDLENERTTDLIEAKEGLERQLSKGQLLPWERTIAELHLDDIKKELIRRA